MNFLKCVQNSNLLRNVLVNGIKYRYYFLNNRKYLYEKPSTLFTRSITSGDQSITMKEVKVQLAQIMGLEKGFKALHPSRAHLLEFMPKKKEDLPSRTMQDSFSSAIIPLSKDVEMQDKYVTSVGSIRMGRLLEDMDLFAVWVAHKHILNPLVKPGNVTPYVIVTVLVDKIDITDFTPMPQADVRLSGHVSWVGNSTLEIVVWLEQEKHDKWQKITRALFVMAARDPTNTQSAVVNPIVPGNDEEQKILSGGEDRRKRRLTFRNTSLLKTIPNTEEQKIMHDLFIKTIDLNYPSYNKRILPGGYSWMENSHISNLIFSHPEHRNLHNRVFGGFLMRHALELSWACAYIFSKYRPNLVHISDIAFHRPVEVSSLIRMQAHIVYSEANFLQVIVYAEVHCPHSNNVTLTNAFHFTYRLPEKMFTIVPRSYNEAMMYIDGRRHFQYVMGLSQHA